MSWHSPNLNWLNLIGLFLNAAGGVLLAIDALGATDFWEELNATENEFRARVTKITYISVINRTFVNLLTCILFFAIYYFANRRHGIVLPLLLAPLAYPSLRILAFTSRKLHNFITFSSPRPPEKVTGCLPALWQLTNSLPWTLAIILSFLLMMAFNFSVDLPLRFLSEKVVAPLLLVIIKNIAALQEKERQMHFRRNAFLGLLLLVVGFAYQLIAITLSLVPCK